MEKNKVWFKKNHPKKKLEIRKICFYKSNYDYLTLLSK